MPQCMVCKGRRPVTESIADQIFDDDVLEASNPLLTNVLDAVVTGFQLSPAFLLSILCNRLRRSTSKTLESTGPRNRTCTTRLRPS